MTLDWNDLRYMIAVADQGSTLAAGQLLGVSQTTVARRISALEAALGGDLFYRQQSGYRPTPLCDSLLDHVRAMAVEADTIADLAAAHRRQLSDTVLITATDLYGATIFPPLLQKLRELRPEIHVELDMSDAPRDLSTGAADIALRIGTVAHDPGLKIRRVAYDRWTVYCSHGYARDHGAPRTIADMRALAIVGGGGPIIWAHFSHWLHHMGLEDAVTIHFGSASGLLGAVRAGVGVSVLPTIVGDNLPDLTRCMPPSQHRSPVWLVTHDRSRDRPAVRAVTDFLAEQIPRLPGA